MFFDTGDPFDIVTILLWSCGDCDECRRRRRCTRLFDSLTAQESRYINAATTMYRFLEQPTHRRDKSLEEGKEKLEDSKEHAGRHHP